MYQKRNDLEILDLYLGDYKKQLYLREISQKSRIPLKTTQTLLAALEKDKILKSQTIGKNKYFRLNLENINTKHLLLQSEVNKTSKFIEKYRTIKTFIKSLSTNDPLIVFGSFAKFTAAEDSDLDLLIIQKEKQKIPLYLMPFKVHKIELTENAFLEALKKQETLVKEIEQNHVILNNHSFFVTVMWNYYGQK